MAFLDRLGKAMQMDEISQEIGIDLHTESLLVRAEQLAKLECDKMVDKVSLCLSSYKIELIDVAGAALWRKRKTKYTEITKYVCLAIVLQLHDFSKDSSGALLPRTALSERSKLCR